MTVTLQSLRLPGLLAVFAASIIALLISYHSAPFPATAVTQSLGSWPRENASIHGNAYQLDPAPELAPWGAIVAASKSTDNMTWLSQVEQNWTVFRYEIDNPVNGDVRLQLPVMKGHEAIVYITWLVEHYDSLPWHVVFVHGDRDDWEQDEEILSKVITIRRNALARAGYVPLRCDWYPSCPAELRPVDHDAVVWGPDGSRNETEFAIASKWKSLFPGTALPHTIASQSSAQFAVTRQAILQRPKSDYERLREWLLRTTLEDDEIRETFEKLWAYIFTGEAVQ
ncbi:hypothetical protein LTR56_010856 [Elasticomyces elasticus]|nr:hypothetical protein LTR56_010856 [Elasticomyces elasticus]KAK3650271.1 hypothetical protein LTR22_012598 [Elasticomyces elasticus]KAK4911862.1 hypothetical protein LTR49_019662 [Elasticomyces elasticus]KAK5768290.1 hypothetical protein LTS12_001429 [Elasticomyces elasticus]